MRVAEALSRVLDPDCGWYADFVAGGEKFVIFADRVFRYARGDSAARAEAEEYARAAGVPDAQLDWGD